MAVSGRNGNNKNIPWWAIVLGFIVLSNVGFLWVLWPIAIFWLVYKAVKKNVIQKDISSGSMQEARMEKYKIMMDGRSVESIDYLASAVGVSFDTAMRDLQRMVAEGRLGARAYINYVDKTVVLDPVGAGEPSRPSYAQPRNRPAGGAAGSNMISRSEGSDAKKKTPSSGGAGGAKGAGAAKGAGSTKGGGAGDEFGYGKQKNLLLILGIILAAIGGLATAGTLSDVYTLRDVFTELIPTVAMAGGGVGCLVYRGYLKKRENRFKLYKAAVTGRDYVDISELASKAGITERKCLRDLDAMLEKGLLPQSSYIDHGEGILVLKPGAAPQQRKEAPVTEPEDDNEDRYKAILRQIRKLNDDIPDEGVSKRIDEMEDLTSRIFKAVQDKPEKEPQIKSFMSYYLPTTLKLLRSYADFESTGAAGGNIAQAKAEIERILDTLVDGFRKQLDKLYEADAMDISSDIDVLETMLRRDGLTGDGSPFGSVQQGRK